MTPEPLGEALFPDSEAVTCTQLASSRDAGAVVGTSFKGQSLYLPSASEGLLNHPSSPVAFDYRFFP